MKKAILSPGYGVQEIPELENLEQAEEAGTYAVAGYDCPVNIQPVTEYGEECLRVSCPDALFFWGDDGNRYYALETGRFA
nr:MAG TPA: hypothetical protein [Caudoviricetes sp.]